MLAKYSFGYILAIFSQNIWPPCSQNVTTPTTEFIQDNVKASKSAKEVLRQRKTVSAKLRFEISFRSNYIGFKKRSSLKWPNYSMKQFFVLRVGFSLLKPCSRCINPALISSQFICIFATIIWPRRMVRETAALRFFVEVRNVERQDVERQNVERQDVERQNVKVQIVDLKM
jgi:hypothetical protein